MRIDEALLNEAKAYAAKNGRTFNSVMEDALRQLLNRSTEVAERPRVELITSDSQLKPGIELTPEFIHNLFEQEDIETLLRVQADAAQ
ncbi:hypothetical protein AB0I81_48295 [Nonomuraea sp. NPDC050404]|uniref:hypothetical protein n=1 Tax=Nonomuraea sp. NPDC050404 TaxID=3155783 RepID=UPI0033DA6EFF